MCSRSVQSNRRSAELLSLPNAACSDIVDYKLAIFPLIARVERDSTARLASPFLDSHDCLLDLLSSDGFVANVSGKDAYGLGVPETAGLARNRLKVPVDGVIRDL